MAEKSNRQEYLYKLLDRLKTDCDYYLGNGNFNAKHLWAGNEQGQIAEMKKIWNQLEEKPEWLTWEQILDYGAKMGVDELPSSVDGSAKETIQTMLDKKTEADIPTQEDNEKVDLEQEKQDLEDTLKQAEEVQELKDQVEEKIDKVLNEECESNLSSQTCDDNNCSEADSKENETQQSTANCKDCDSEMSDETNKKEESEDVNPYTGVELSDSEEAQLDTLLDRNLAEEFRALSKEEQQEYLGWVPYNKHMLSPILIKELAEKYNLDEKILYWVVNVQLGDVQEYLKEDNEWEKEEQQDKEVAGEFPENDYVTKILSPIEITQVNFADNLTQEQKNYIEAHIGNLQDVEDEFIVFGQVYLKGFKQDEPIMSIKDYIISLEEEVAEENNRK